MREPYTPTTGQVREAYIVNKGQWRQSAGRGFDAWLDQVKAEARREGQAEAWEQGYSDCWTFHQSNGLSGSRENPYRKEADQ